MDVTFDPAKRRLTLQERELDFADAGDVFEGLHVTLEDTRRDYGEPRFITAGELDGRLVVLVWTPREETRRIISMRHAHDREAQHWRRLLG